MTIDTILDQIAPAHREAARPVIEAHLPKLRELSEKLAPLMATTRKLAAEMAR